MASRFDLVSNRHRPDGGVKIFSSGAAVRFLSHGIKCSLIRYIYYIADDGGARVYKTSRGKYMAAPIRI